MAEMIEKENAAYCYAWGPRLSIPGMPVLDRKGEPCDVIARGRMNSALVRFSDGFTAVVSRNALRRLRDGR